MTTFLTKLRIGEKILISFGLVTLIMLGIIWHYHHSFETVLDNYKLLYDVFESKKTSTSKILNAFTEARRAEKDFLLYREERFADEVNRYLEIVQQKSKALANDDKASRNTTDQIRSLTNEYKQGFDAVADAWRIKGLDHNSGLQGNFRKRVHELQRISGNFNVDRLYYQLLQIRRSEKDLALRTDTGYRDKVSDLIIDFRNLVENSQLKASEKKALLKEIDIYQDAFSNYAVWALSNKGINEGKGPFRQAAHRIEAILDKHHVQDMETQVLALRRREKDYLLRLDTRYVEMVQQIAQSIRGNITAASISTDDKELIIKLLGSYEKDFLALVQQNAHIEKHLLGLNKTSEQIADLIYRNSVRSSESMVLKVREIAKLSLDSIYMNLTIAITAVLAGILLALIITRSIIHPVKQMAGLLNELTLRIPSTRIPTIPNSRDEINCMAESLNTLIEHRANFLKWWETAMQEEHSRKDLETASTHDEKADAAKAMQSAARLRLQQIRSIRDQITKCAENVLGVAAQLRVGNRRTARSAADTLEQCARSISMMLQVVDNKNTGAGN